MSLDFRPAVRRLAAAVCFAVCVSCMVDAQNVSSPYSILGIGDLSTKDKGRYFGMSGTGIALQHPDYLNFNNPASLAGLNYKVVNYQLNFQGKVNTLRLPSGTDGSISTKDLVVNRLGLSFKPSQRWGFSFGLQPYSTVSYLVDQNTTLFNGSQQLSKSVDGSGGLYQGYLSTGYQVNHQLSFGVTASYLFGGLSRTTQYQSDAFALNVERTENQTLYGFQLKGGLQYAIAQNSNVSHRFGLTIANPTTLNGQSITAYNEDQAAIKKEVSDATGMRLPLEVGAGYALVFHQTLTLAADYSYSNWKKQKLDYANSYTGPSQRVSVGLEYASNVRVGTALVEQYYLQAGAAYETSYMRIRQKTLKEMSISFGAGGAVARQLNIYAGLETGRKGSLADDQIRENYVQFNFGLILRDVWTGARFRRYD